MERLSVTVLICCHIVSEIAQCLSIKRNILMIYEELCQFFNYFCGPSLTSYGHLIRKTTKWRFCNIISQLHKRLGELRQVQLIINTQVKLICLYCFGWTLLHLLRSHFLYPVQAAILKLLNPYKLYGVAAALCDTLQQAGTNCNSIHLH